MTQGEERFHVGDFQYACGDQGFEALFVQTRTRKGWARSDKTFDLPVRWGDGEETAMPVHSVVEKTKKFNERQYYYLVDEAHAPDTVAAMAAHDVMHIQIPAKSKREPFWTAARLDGAIAGIASAMDTCGLTKSALGPLPER